MFSPIETFKLSYRVEVTSLTNEQHNFSFKIIMFRVFFPDRENFLHHIPHAMNIDLELCKMEFSKRFPRSTEYSICIIEYNIFNMGGYIFFQVESFGCRV